ncbi:hypothetical protein [Pseudoalteromonas mariniglutinosa]|uniref:hypothetical protein n=1 Tax=Pseudoalteromonas mariniglutinosa TaxID=206042 RepID=UPI00384AEB41
MQVATWLADISGAKADTGNGISLFVIPNFLFYHPKMVALFVSRISLTRLD